MGKLINFIKKIFNKADSLQDGLNAIEGKFAPGGLSQERIINGKSYFAPNVSCIHHGGYATNIYH